MTEKHIQMAFNLFDTDKNGKISVEEFYKLINPRKEAVVEHTKQFNISH